VLNQVSGFAQQFFSINSKSFPFPSYNALGQKLESHQNLGQAVFPSIFPW